MKRYNRTRPPVATEVGWVTDPTRSGQSPNLRRCPHRARIFHPSTLTTLGLLVLVLATAVQAQSQDLRVATFEVDASPPIGSPLAYDPTKEIVKPLSARGLVLLGAEEPILLCAVDWIGIGNQAHDAWRAALADAAGTRVERVTVHTVHQHDAPFVDFSADDLLAEHGLGGQMFDRQFVEDTIQRAAEAAREAIEDARPVTHVGTGSAVVDRVASNRRLLDRSGRVRLTRFSASRNEEARQAPVGRVDPEVRLVSLWHEQQPLAVLSYFASHPMSYYRTGGANPDFPGIARAARQQATGAMHLYFTGAAGNVAAGKWNDGSPPYRQILADRLADGMRRAWETTERTPVTPDQVQWRVVPVALQPAEHLDADQLRQLLADADQPADQRRSAARALAWLNRCLEGHRIDLTSLRLGPARILHMPGELNIEFQLAAAAMYPDDFVALAAYGEYAPGYIAPEIAYFQGGYEASPRASRVASRVQQTLLPAIARLLEFDDFQPSEECVRRVGYRLERFYVDRGFDGIRCWVHARAGVMPVESGDNPIGLPTVLMTAQPLELAGSDVFHGLHTFRTRDLGLTWEGPFEEPALRRETIDDDRERVVSDFTPQWHAASGTMLGIGHTVKYKNNRVMPVRPRATAYTVYDVENFQWRPWKKLELPDEPRFANAGAGSVQRFDQPDGTVLLPIYFKEKEARQYHSTVLRCRFDGQTLEYLEHGSELTIDVGRGLYEPSLTFFDGAYYLTMRNDEDAYVARSQDGLHFDEPRPWTFDDGRSLGSYNTQQHWVTHSDALYLAYTRRGANNDHVFRHRAPLFLAKVDPQSLQIIEATEQIIVPERGARLGNFGVVDISPHETWVTAAEWMQPPGVERYGSDNMLHVARLKWTSPNRTASAQLTATDATEVQQ